MYLLIIPAVNDIDKAALDPFFSLQGGASHPGITTFVTLDDPPEIKRRQFVKNVS